MNDPFTQFTKTNLEQAINHYESTGEILDVLLVCFDQHGIWCDPPCSLDYDDNSNLSDQVIPENRLVTISSNEEKILLCTYRDYSADPVNIDYHHVAGAIGLSRARQFSALNLQTVGADIFVCSATIFNTPNLRKVGQFLNAGSATRFDVPRLHTVGDFIVIPSATIIDISNLQTVCGFFCVRSVKTFNAPSLKNVGDTLDAAAASTFSAPNLETVNGGLIAESATSFDASKLVRVDGGLILPKATMEAVLPNCPAARYKIAEQI